MSSESEINIKHRLTGAAILIALGVIVLPLLLGSYSNNDIVSNNGVDSKEVKEKMTSKNNTSFKNIEEGDIKVFVSKIRPLGDEVNAQADAKEKKVAETVISSKSEPVSKVDESSDEDLKNKLASSMSKPLIKRKDSSTKNSSSTKPSHSETVAKPVDDSQKKTSKKPQIAKVAVKPKPLVKAKKSVTEGYIVSVGVYLQSTNAENVMTKLSDKGFKPSQGIFNTSKGPATRVWLGPFETRAEAGKKKTQLEEAMGERGLIKRYP